MTQAVQNFVDQTDKLAEKYDAKVTVGVDMGDGRDHSVVVSDHTKEEGSVALESMIQEEYKNSIRIKELRKKQMQMYKDAFENDATYHEQSEQLERMKKELKATKERIAQQPALFALKSEVANLNYELKESKEKLSDLLLSYSEQTGARQLELFDGELTYIVKSAKLVKRSEKR